MIGKLIFFHYKCINLKCPVPDTWHYTSCTRLHIHTSAVHSVYFLYCVSIDTITKILYLWCKCICMLKPIICKFQLFQTTHFMHRLNEIVGCLFSRNYITLHHFWIGYREEYKGVYTTILFLCFPCMFSCSLTYVFWLCNKWMHVFMYVFCLRNKWIHACF